MPCKALGRGYQHWKVVLYSPYRIPKLGRDECDQTDEEQVVVAPEGPRNVGYSKDHGLSLEPSVSLLAALFFFSLCFSAHDNINTWWTSAATGGMGGVGVGRIRRPQSRRIFFLHFFFPGLIVL